MQSLAGNNSAQWQATRAIRLKRNSSPAGIVRAGRENFYHFSDLGASVTISFYGKPWCGDSIRQSPATIQAALRLPRRSGKARASSGCAVGGAALDQVLFPLRRSP